MDHNPPPPETSRPRLPITVLIPTYNEAHNLADCLASVTWADEVFVVDSFSTDGTPDIASAAGARVVQHIYVNSATQKNWAIPQCTHRWVLVVDADERVTPELAKDIQTLLGLPGGPPAAAYQIPRMNWLFGRQVRFSGWGSDRLIRFFDRTRAQYRPMEVHSDMDVQGPVGHISGAFHHHTYQTYDQYHDKFTRYTTWAANDLWKRGVRARVDHFLIRVPFRFIRTYVFKLGFLDGLAGLQLSYLAAFAVFMKYAKLQAMERAVQSGARDHRGRLIIHAGASIQPAQEVIAGGRPPADSAAEEKHGTP